MSESTRDLVIRGVAAAKIGDVREARFYLEWVLRLDPPIQEKLDALYWLSEISTDPKQQRDYLETLLANEPTDARARRKMAVLQGKLDPRDIIDPDQPAQPAPVEPQAASAKRFVCPRCGGRMTYTPDGLSLMCESCESRERLVKKKTGSLQEPVKKEDFLVAMAMAKGHRHPIVTHAVTCQGCGAQFILPPAELTRSCPYCNTSYILEQVETRELDAPNGIIPFTVNEKQARQLLRAWLEKQGFETMPRVAAGRGLYLPVWTFDVGGIVRWTCQMKSGDRWEQRSGERLVGHTDLPIFATHRLPAAILPAVAGYHLNEMAPFDERYLASWMAETYQESSSDSSLHARQYALLQAQRKIEGSFFGQFRDLHINSSQIVIEAYRLVLVPAWRTYMIHEQQRFEIFINGQTGEVISVDSS